jgi:hypothetical protein
VAIAFDATSTAISTSEGAGSTFTFAHTVAAGADRLLVIFVAYFGHPQLLTVEFDGVAAIHRESINRHGPAGDTMNLEIYTLTAPAVGTHDVDITFTGGGFVAAIWANASSWQGVSQSAQPLFIHPTGYVGGDVYGSDLIAPGILNADETIGVNVIDPAGMEMAIEALYFHDVTLSGGTTVTATAGQTVLNATDFIGSNEEHARAAYLATGTTPALLRWSTSMAWSGTREICYLGLSFNPAAQIIDAAGTSDGIATTAGNLIWAVDGAATADGVATAFGIGDAGSFAYGTSAGASTALGVPAPPAPIEIEPATPQDPPNTGKLVATQMTWAANQARVLTIEHHIKANDFDSMLSIGDYVLYNDPDLGVVFIGHIFERVRHVKSGEGVTYQAADTYRFLQKQPARLVCTNSVPAYSDFPLTLGTTHVHLLEGTTIADAIELITESIRQPGFDFLPLGIDHELLPADLEIYKAMDKGGMTIGTWLTDILDQTEGGCAYIQFMQVLGNWIEGLRVYDYYEEPDITLLVGAYVPISPVNATPLVVEAEVKDTCDNKFYKVTVEGGGDYERKVGQYLEHHYCSIDGNPIGPTCFNPPSCTSYRTRIRWYFSETNVLGFHFDENGECKDEVSWEFDSMTAQGNPPIPTNSHFSTTMKPILDLDDVGCDGQSPNLDKCKYYVQVEILHGGIGPGGSGAPAAPVITNTKMNYTVYNGPLVAQAPALPGVANVQLLREGEYMIQRPELTKFFSPGRVTRFGSTDVILEIAVDTDPTAELQDIADRYYRRYSQLVNTAGTITVHIKGVTGNLTPGARIANFGPNTNVRVRSMSFDFVARNIQLDVSDHPLREFMREKKDLKIEQQKQNLNWRDRTPARLTEPCLPSVALTVHPEGCPCVIVDDWPVAGYT